MELKINVSEEEITSAVERSVRSGIATNASSYFSQWGIEGVVKKMAWDECESHIRSKLKNNDYMHKMVETVILANLTRKVNQYIKENPIPIEEVIEMIRASK